MLGLHGPSIWGSSLNQKTSGVKPDDPVPQANRGVEVTPRPATEPNRRELHDRLLTAALDRADETVVDVLNAAARMGMTGRGILTQLVTGVARELGRQWHDDDISFLDVTLGTGKLQRSIHELGLASARRTTDVLGRVLITTVPGEQHVLGAVVGSRLLSLEGCEATLDIRGSRDVDVSAADGFDLVAIAVPSERSRHGLGDMVGKLRDGLRRRSCSIVIVGRDASEDLAGHVGADASIAGDDDVLRMLHRGRTYES